MELLKGVYVLGIIAITVLCFILFNFGLSLVREPNTLLNLLGLAVIIQSLFISYFGIKKLLKQIKKA